MSDFLRRWYGSGPAHLVALTLGAIVGLYAGIKLVQVNPLGVAIWLLAGAALHDVVLVPAYTALDRAGRGAAQRPDWWNFVRVPTMLSALLLLVFFPLVFRLTPDFVGITGTPISVYSGRYLAVVAGLFAVSAVAYVVRLLVRHSGSTERAGSTSSDRSTRSVQSTE